MMVARNPMNMFKQFVELAQSSMVTDKIVFNALYFDLVCTDYSSFQTSIYEKMIAKHLSSLIVEFENNSGYSGLRDWASFQYIF